MPALRAYTAHDGAPEEVAVLVFAHSAAQARPLAFDALRGFNGDSEYTDLRVRWIHNAEHLFAKDAHPEKLARGEAHVVDNLSTCSDCMQWGEPINDDGLCPGCVDYHEANE